jgi:hypothetical protein
VMNYPQYPPPTGYPSAPYATAPAAPVAPPKRSRWGWFLGIGGVIALLLCLVITASGGYYFYTQKQSQDKTATAQAHRSTERAQERTSEAATQEAYPDLNVYNGSGTDICYFYMSEPGSTSWGDELLEGDVIYTGDDYDFEDIEPGDYDAIALDCSYNSINTAGYPSVSLYDDSEISITAAIANTPAGGQGGSGTVNLYIVNDTDVTICYVRYSAAGAPSWEGDLLGSSTLPAYGTFTASLVPGQYDLQAEDCNSHSMLFESYVSVYSDYNWYVEGYCGNGACDTWEDSSTCSADCGSSGDYGTINLTIYNQTDTTVCYVYYGPVGASSWTGDLLGSSVLSSYSSFVATLDAGNYQLQAEDCEHNVMYYEPNYSVYSSAAWYIY